MDIEIIKEGGTDYRTLEREEEFHDEWANSINPEEVPVLESFQACTAPEGRYISKVLGNVRGKTFLDIGAGAGEASVYFALKGADVTATDLSAQMLKVVGNLAKFYNTSLQTVVANAEKLPFDDNTFDIVYAGNILHHVNLPKALAEIQRVLKPGGVFVSWDALQHNPIINIYRYIAVNTRTQDEHPLSIKDIHKFKQLFTNVSFNCFWFCTLWIFISFFLVEKVNPNRERYWKKVILEHRRLEATYSRLEKIDKIVLKMLPFLKRFCWNIVVVCRK
jgi:ubiquinone/menaquinone biosynthesis C-methylase UbiE